MAFAPTMDLTAYNADFLWMATINVGCIPDLTAPYPGTEEAGCQTNGGEEIGVIGGVGPTEKMPEPTVLALIGLGLAGFGYAKRRGATKGRI